MELIGSLLLQASNQWTPKNEYEYSNLSENKTRFTGRRLLNSRQQSAFFKSANTSYTTYFERREGIDFDSYLTLPHGERPSEVQCQAAAKIQAAWRGFLIRSNRKILERAVVKIQARVRGFLARKRYQVELAAFEEKKRQYLMNNSASKIQAWWKGIQHRRNEFDFKRYRAIKGKAESVTRLIEIQARWRGIASRRKKFDFKRYKEIKEKNEALNRSIERINEMERALLKSLDPRENSDGFDCAFLTTSNRSLNDDSCSKAAPSLGHCVSPMISLSNLSPSLEQFILNKLPEIVDEMSETRIAELYAFLASLETGMKTENKLEKLVKKVGGIQNLSVDDLAKLEESRKNQRERANAILNLAKAGLMSNRSFKKEMLQRKEDSLDDLFPPMPCRDDVIQPDLRKVKALKDAIRLFRQQSKAKEKRELQRMHVLLRTRACPGVYSDICSTELTQFERKLKSVKYWKNNGSTDTQTQRQPPSKTKDDGKNKRLKRLFAHALKISSSNKVDEVKQQQNDNKCDHKNTSKAADGGRANGGYCGQEINLNSADEGKLNTSHINHIHCNKDVALWGEMSNNSWS